MADLIRKVTLERGYDPRDFVMMAYGGCGPAHAGAYGADVGSAEIVIPYFATVHSAFGAALSDVRFSLRHSEPIVLPVDPARLEAIYQTMEVDGTRALAAADVPADRRVFRRWVEARFRRQVHHVRVDAPSRFDPTALSALAVAFEHEYERLFGPGSALKDAGIELVNYGVDAIGVVDKPAIERAPPGGTARPRTERPTWCPRARAMVATPIYDGPSLAPGTELHGPAVIEHPGTTIVAASRPTCANRRLAPHPPFHPLTGLRMLKRANATIDPVDLRGPESPPAQHRRGDGDPVHALLGFERAHHGQRRRHRDHAARRRAGVGGPLHRHPGQRAAAHRREHDAARRRRRLSATATSSSATIPTLARSTRRTSRPSRRSTTQGELIAWIGASGHQLDTGGMDPGGFSVKAVDMHQEGLRMPPVKIVEAGRGARGRAPRGSSTRCATRSSGWMCAGRSPRSMPVGGASSS